MSTAASAKPPRRARVEEAKAAAAEVDEPFLEPEDRDEPVSRLPQVLNRDEMLSLAKKYATEIMEAVATGESEREKALRAKDAIKLSCIQDRLANLKIMKRLSDARLAASERNRIRDDDLNLRHEFRGVELAHQRVVKLSQELLRCMGESLDVSISGDDRPVPSNEDPTGAHLPPTPIDRPPPASPYK
ncbi:MAG TPA: hypothetical protein VHU40_21035 [Polyangia bacterium]|nr:hypothetical protein [Polyangia bacterium]